ncbi:MAG: D-alanine--D-alanine ligase [Calditrichaeota bacterium]|nr:MAG: D-alanine--D-alanine ligase [Calditrichota bacterium]
MNKKIRVAILMGGKSAEHEVSLQSAKSIFEALDKSKYEPVLIGIDKEGAWHLLQSGQFLVNPDNPKTIALNLPRRALPGGANAPEPLSIQMAQNQPIGPIDVVFPVLHGPMGEDGTVQGLLKLLNIPFVGAGVIGSAIGMDKDVMKRLFREAGLPTAKFLVYRAHEMDRIRFSQVAKALGVPFFIKPANLGSSVGIHKVAEEAAFEKALQDAFQYDSKIIVEEYIAGREIECSVLGNEWPIASLPGEVIPSHEFYSYEAKYIDENGALLQIPANLPENLVKEIQSLAIRAFQVLCCEGLARVDFFLRDNGQILINEINTLPGFTRISMYPKLWEVSGIPYSELIDRLIQLALERFEKESRLRTRVNSNTLEDETHL